MLLRGLRVIAIEEPPDNRRMRESRKLRRRTNRWCFRETTRIGIDKRVIQEESRTLAVLLRGLRVIAIEERPDNRRMRESRKLRRRTSRWCFRETTRIGIDKRVIREESRTLAVLLRGLRVTAIEEPPDNRRMRESRKLRRRTSRWCFRETTRIGIDKRVIREEERTLAVLLRGLRVTAIEEPPDNRRMRESRKLRRRTSPSCFRETTRIAIDNRTIREESRTLAV